MSNTAGGAITNRFSPLAANLHSFRERVQREDNYFDASPDINGA